MLRGSLQYQDQELDLRSINDRSLSSGSIVADALLTFTDALIGRDAAALSAARTALEDCAGPTAVAPAAGAAGNFEMMNRILDATGVPVSRSMEDITTLLFADNY